MSDESELWRRLSMIRLAPYLQCPACRQVVFDPDRQLARLDQSARCCGASGEARILWPSPETYGILEIAKKQQLDSWEGKRVAIVFLATALEMFLESVLWELLEAQNSSTLHSEVVLDGYQGRERRVELFKVLSGASVSEVLKAKNLEIFLADWGVIIKARNDIVHGKYSSERNDDPKASIKRVIEKCFDAFAELHNHAVSANITRKPR